MKQLKNKFNMKNYFYTENMSENFNLYYCIIQHPKTLREQKLYVIGKNLSEIEEKIDNIIKKDYTDYKLLTTEKIASSYKYSNIILI